MEIIICLGHKLLYGSSDSYAQGVHGLAQIYGFSRFTFLLPKSLSHKDILTLRIRRLCSHHVTCVRWVLPTTCSLPQVRCIHNLFYHGRKKESSPYNTSIIWYAPRLKQGCVRTFLIQPFGRTRLPNTNRPYYSALSAISQPMRDTRIKQYHKMLIS